MGTFAPNAGETKVMKVGQTASRVMARAAQEPKAVASQGVHASGVADECLEIRDWQRPDVNIILYISLREHTPCMKNLPMMKWTIWRRGKM